VKNAWNSLIRISRVVDN